MAARRRSKSGLAPGGFGCLAIFAGILTFSHCVLRYYCCCCWSAEIVCRAIDPAEFWSYDWQCGFLASGGAPRYCRALAMLRSFSLIDCAGSQRQERLAAPRSKESLELRSMVQVLSLTSLTYQTCLRKLHSAKTQIRITFLGKIWNLFWDDETKMLIVSTQRKHQKIPPQSTNYIRTHNNTLIHNNGSRSVKILFERITQGRLRSPSARHRLASKNGSQTQDL